MSATLLQLSKRLDSTYISLSHIEGGSCLSGLTRSNLLVVLYFASTLLCIAFLSNSSLGPSTVHRLIASRPPITTTEIRPSASEHSPAWTPPAERSVCDFGWHHPQSSILKPSHCEHSMHCHAIPQRRTPAPTMNRTKGLTACTISEAEFEALPFTLQRKVSPSSTFLTIILL